LSQQYKVRQGDCISSIGFRFGVLPDKLWDHPDNAKLRELRKDPNVLQPGDALFIPDPEAKAEARGTSAKHKFVRKGVRETLKIRFLDMLGRPQESVPFSAVIDGVTTKGVTDGEGALEIAIRPDAARALIILGDGTDDPIDLCLGALDPADSVTGVQARLTNLGVDVGPVDGILGPLTTAGIAEFQRQRGLPETGEIDEATSTKLAEVHRSSGAA
jgi:N-acetylmuramoyl-L-alanine amidase